MHQTRIKIVKLVLTSSDRCVGSLSRGGNKLFLTRFVCELFSTDFLLPLISPEYSFVDRFGQHCAFNRCVRQLSKLNVASSAVRNWHSHRHHENVHATSNPIFSLFPPYNSLLQAFVMSLKGIRVAKHTILFYSRRFQIRRDIYS
jgi:hypothetical protein